MKNAILFLLLFATLHLVAQNYTPFNLTDGTVWQESSQYGIGSTPGTEGYHTTSFSYLLNGDTLVDGLEYKKVYSRIDWEVERRIYSTGVDMYDTILTVNNFSTPYELIGAIRQEVENERVYYISWVQDQGHFSYECLSYYVPFGQEVLMYDFNVEQGDTVSVGNQTAVVEHVGSINMVDGSTRKSISLSDGNTTWVTELGGELGLFSVWMHYPLESGCFLLCYNGEIPSHELWLGGFYTGDMNETCDQQIISSSKELIHSPSAIYLQPNPTHDYVEIKSSLELVLKQPEFHIFNAIGQHKISQQLNETSQVLSLQHWPNGLYFVNIVIDGQTVLTRTLVKH